LQRITSGASRRALSLELHRADHRIAIRSNAKISSLDWNISVVAHPCAVLKRNAHISSALVVIVASDVLVCATSGRNARIFAASISVITRDRSKHTTKCVITSVVSAVVTIVANESRARAVSSVRIALTNLAERSIRSTDDTRALGARGDGGVDTTTCSIARIRSASISIRARNCTERTTSCSDTSVVSASVSVVANNIVCLTLTSAGITSVVQTLVLIDTTVNS